jgi:two-component system, LuxR family, response regulator FixJ
MMIRGIVYVVDDDLSVGQSIKRILSFYDYDVHSFCSGKELFEKAAFNVPAVLLLDMRMPGQSGLDVQQRLTDAGIEMPIIFISGDSLPQEIVNGMKKGAVDFLFKPFDMEELIRVVDCGLASQKEKLTHLANLKDTHQKYASLTQRQRQVCDFLVQGLDNKTIAANLGVTYDAVKLHKRLVLEKMQAESVVVLTRMLIHKSSSY